MMKSEKIILLEHMGYTIQDVEALMQDKALYRRGVERERILEALAAIRDRLILERSIIETHFAANNDLENNREKRESEEL